MESSADKIEKIIEELQNVANIRHRIIDPITGKYTFDTTGLELLDVADELEVVAMQLAESKYHYPQEVVMSKEQLDSFENFTPFSITKRNGFQILAQRYNSVWMTTRRGGSVMSLDDLWHLIEVDGARVVALAITPISAEYDDDEFDWSAEWS